jgi:hypothetical protein
MCDMCRLINYCIGFISHTQYIYIHITINTDRLFVSQQLMSVGIGAFMINITVQDIILRA